MKIEYDQYGHPYLMIWEGDDEGFTERERMRVVAQQPKVELLRISKPFIGFWLIEHHRRLHFQPRLCICWLEWVNKPGWWSTYISFFGFTITHWPYVKQENKPWTDADSSSS